MNERIRFLIEYLDLSPSQFADQLGILRSSISHVLNDRNKPGLDLIQKTLMHFPEISERWLLLNEGPMLKSAEKKVDVGKAFSEDKNTESRKNTETNSLQADLFEKSATSNENSLNANQSANKALHENKSSGQNKNYENEEIKFRNINSAITEDYAKAKPLRITLYFDDKTYQDYFPD